MCYFFCDPNCGMWKYPIVLIYSLGKWFIIYCQNTSQIGHKKSSQFLKFVSDVIKTESKIHALVSCKLFLKVWRLSGLMFKLYAHPLLPLIEWISLHVHLITNDDIPLFLCIMWHYGKLDMITYMDERPFLAPICWIFQGSLLWRWVS